MKNILITVFIINMCLISCGSDHSSKEDLINTSASLTESLIPDMDPLNGRVITTLINKKQKTMSTLYGNEAAFQYANNKSPVDTTGYPGGTKLALVTWSQKPDQHWFGANIPGKIQKIQLIEFKETASGNIQPIYNIYYGSPLKLSKEADSAVTAKNLNFIIHLKRSLIPE